MADTQATLVLKVNIAEIAKLKEVAKNLDTIKEKAKAFNSVSREASTAKTSIKEMTTAVSTAQSAMGKLERGMASANTSIATWRQGLFSWSERMIDVNKKLLGFGKNIQWTGRQLTYGFSLPIALAGFLAVKTAMGIESSWIRVKKVYGDTATEATSFAEVQEKILSPAVDRLSLVFAQSKNDIVDIMASWAAMGVTGKDLANITQETMSYMVAGDIDAAKATEYLSSAVAIFNLNTEQAHTSMAQLNAVENATKATMVDLGEAIMRVGESASQAGLSIADTAAYVAQLRSSGATATVSGRALRSVIGSLAKPTSEAIKLVSALSQKYLGVGLNMNSAAFQSMSFKKRMEELGRVYEKLSEAQKNQLALVVAGKDQFARFSSLLKGVVDETSAYHITLAAALDPSVVANYEKEVVTVLESAPMMWQGLKVAVENMAASWGGIISQTLMPLVQWLIGLASAFRKISPEVQRNITIFLALAAVLGPVLMYIGFIAQGLAVLKIAFFSLTKMIGLSTGSFLIFLSVLMALCAAFKLNIGGMGDWVKGLMNNIKELTYSIGDIGKVVDESATGLKSLGGVMNKTGEDMADGIGEGLGEGLSSLTNSNIRNQMETFGMALQKNFLKGFSEVDTGMLSTAISLIKDYYNDLIQSNEMSVENALSGIKSSINSVAEAIANSNATKSVLNIYDALKDKIGAVNAEMLNSVLAAQQKVGKLDAELEAHKKIYEAAKSEYEAQKEYVDFLTQSNKDISIEVTTSEKNRMWEIKAKIKEVSKANLEELQAEKRKALILAKGMKDQEKDIKKREEELNAAKDLLKIEQELMQIRRSMLDMVQVTSTAGGLTATTGLTDVAATMPDLGGTLGGLSEFGAVSGEFDKNVDGMMDKLKDLGKVAEVVGLALLGGALNRAVKTIFGVSMVEYAKSILGLTSALKILAGLGVAAATIYTISVIFKFWKGTEEIKTNIEDALSGTLQLMDNLRKQGNYQAAIEIGVKFSLDMQNLDKMLAGAQEKIITSFGLLLGGAVIALLGLGTGGAAPLIALTLGTLMATIPFVFDMKDVTVKDWSKEFVNLAWDLIKSLGNFNPFDVIFDTGKLREQITEAIRNLPSTISSAFSSIKPVIDNVVNWFAELPGRIWNATDDILTSWKKLPQNLREVWSDIKTKFSTWISEMSIGANFSSIVNNILTSFKNLPQNLAEIWDKIKSGFLGIFSNANFSINLEPLKTKFNELVTFFKEIPNRIKNTLRTYGGWLGTFIADHFQTGGLVSGNFSQAVPVIAHGGEMILNRHQQSELFNQLNNPSPMSYEKNNGNNQINYTIEFNVGNMICSEAEKREFARSIQRSLQQDVRRIGPAL